jgi:hypothetical protein
MRKIVDRRSTRHTSLCATVSFSLQIERDDVTGAQDASAFFQANYAERFASEVVDRSLLTSVGSEVEIREKTICIIRHIGVVKIKGGIDECGI